VKTARPKAAAAPAAAPDVRAPRSMPRAILAAGYLLLILAAAGLLARRGQTIASGLLRNEAAVPYLMPLIRQEDVRSVRDAIARSRMQRIDFSIQVYYLLNRGYPENLKYLVTAHLLRPSAILDPLGRPFEYQVLPGGYRIAFFPTGTNAKSIEIVNSPEI
jgi:hypothetical protein